MDLIEELNTRDFETEEEKKSKWVTMKKVKPASELKFKVELSQIKQPPKMIEKEEEKEEEK